MKVNFNPQLAFGGKLTIRNHRTDKAFELRTTKEEDALIKDKAHTILRCSVDGKIGLECSKNLPERTAEHMLSAIQTITSEDRFGAKDARHKAALNVLNCNNGVSYLEVDAKGKAVRSANFDFDA